MVGWRQAEEAELSVGPTSTVARHRPMQVDKAGARPPGKQARSAEPPANFRPSKNNKSLFLSVLGNKNAIS